ncbi:MAG TPA: AAA family ATPase [Candidatus Hydrogenedentes bacterium]|nr:AAA family ATPase [Candidatus Hydrogenedentota bacterium]HIJ72474.1 AAA family ATPase [Candidatus Hydrogenedentota bacterium]
MTGEFGSDVSFLPPEFGAPIAPEPRLNIKRMLRLRAPLILGVFVVLAIPSVLAAWFLTPLEYRATANLRFLASTPRVLYDNRSWRSSVPYESFVNTQINLITGDAILSRVKDAPEVRAIPFIADSPDPLLYLKSKINAGSERNNELVVIAFRSTDREAAVLILEKVINIYMEYALNEEANTESERLIELGKEQDRRARELDAELRKISDLQNAAGTPLANIGQFGPSETESYRDTFARAEEDLAKAESQVTQATQQGERIRQLRDHYKDAPQEPIFELGIEDRVAADPRVNYLREQVVARETELALLAENRGKDSVRLKSAREDYETLKWKLASVESAARGEKLNSAEAALNEQLTAYEKARENAIERKKKFQELIDKHEQRAIAASAELAQLEEHKMKAEEIRSVLRTIRQQIAEISMESNAPARVRLVSQPHAPSRPEGGKRLQLLVLAVMGSLSVGLAAGLWRELTDQHTRSAEDISGITRLPVLATIPHLAEDRFAGRAYVPLLAGDSPNSPIADEFRRILARIVYPPESSVEINSCMIASATRGDGKTSLACNLAISLARANRRVLLVDICPRDPSIEWCFGLEPAPGLAEVLYGGASARTLAQPTDFPNLKVLGPGLRTDGLSGTLASREMTEFLEQTEQDFDHIVIDTPPALLMSDAKLLAPIVDGVIIAVGVNVSTHGMLRRCLREMEHVNANIIGLVINGIRPTRGGYLRRNIDLYYGYSRDRSRSEKAEDLPEIRIADEGDERESEPVILLTADSKGREDEA